MVIDFRNAFVWRPTLELTRAAPLASDMKQDRHRGVE
jgi:hypothetical protein